MGKPNCSFPRYVDHFMKSSVPSETASTPEDAGGSGRGKDIMGAQGAGDSEASRAAEVAAARAEKATASSSSNERRKGTPPTLNPSKGGGYSSPPPSADASRKRTSRESSVFDTHGAPEGLGFGHEGIDYSFRYHYKDKSVAFTLDKDSCAELASQIPGDFTKFSSVDSISETTLYSSWAHESFKAIGAGNSLVETYERKVKTAKDSEAEARKWLLAERKTSLSYRRDLDKKRGELKSLREKHESETARLRASQESFVKIEQEKVAEQYARVDRLRKRISSEEAVKESLLMLSQIRGTKECLEDLRSSGVDVPEEKMEQLAADEAKWTDIVEKFDIFDLLDGDLAEPATGGDDYASAV